METVCVGVGGASYLYFIILFFYFVYLFVAYYSPLRRHKTSVEYSH